MSVSALNPEFRHCPKCDSVKLRTDFTIRKSGPKAGTAVAYCKTCTAAAAQRANQDDDTLYRRVQWPSKLKRNYGITPVDYFRMLDEQNGGCAICEAKTPSDRHYSRRGKAEMFGVDHCHSTGRVRGLLCHLCNRALGLIRDNPAVADKMSAYLRQGD